MNKTFGIISFSYGFAGYKSGAELGPKTIMSLGLLDRIKTLGLNCKDYGSTGIELNKESPLVENIKNKESLDTALREVYELTKNCLSKNDFPIILGGDHSVTLGTYNAFKDHLNNKKIGLLWVDTHADLNTPDSSISKNAHGMTLGFLTGLAKTNFNELFTNKIEFCQIVYIGLRDLDEAEKKFIVKNNIKYFTIKEIDKFGIGNIMQQAIDYLNKNSESFLLSFDLDVVDPALAPGTGTPVRGGLTFRESHYIIETAVESGKMIGFELVELNPTLDINHQTAELAVSLIESAVGKTII
jgi:arginase